MYRITADLQAGDTDRIAAHLLRLSPEDRSMRFSSGVVTDESIRRYVGRIRIGHDLVLGLVSQRGHLFGLAHGCVFEQSGQLHVEAAFSVDAAWRGVGLGKALMEALQQRASERASERVALVGMCAPRNWPMRRIFEGAGLALHREDDEMHARGWVLPRQAASRVAARGLAS
jgi:GNAT superfamily N-acetyltransferase